MKTNVGGIDRILRIVVGLALVAWALLGGPVRAWLGAVPRASGLMGFCARCPLLGINTCPMKK